MGMFSFLTGKSPEEMEMAGDKFVKAGEFGAAKIEFEKALTKAENKFPEKGNLIQRLNEKIRDAKESLALSHMQHSKQLIDSGSLDEAVDLLQLALELTENDVLTEQIKTELAELEREYSSADQQDSKMFMAGADPFTSDETDGDEEYFQILCNSLPEEIGSAYLNYSPAFRQGFIALNNGDFQTAVEQFTHAMEMEDIDQPLIPLELATALVHLQQYNRAMDLLDDYIAENDQDTRAYQIFCEIFWDTGNFESAIALLEQSPAPVNESFPIKMLLGETRYQMGHYDDAESLFIECETRFGQNEIATRALAKTYEAMGHLEKARDVYARILNGCTQCGVRTDPFIQRRYAELCFACGERSSQLLDLYLSIMRDDPDNKDEYYPRIYELYTAMGNTAEAERYKSFIKQ